MIVIFFDSLLYNLILFLILFSLNLFLYGIIKLWSIDLRVKLFKLQKKTYFILTRAIITVVIIFVFLDIISMIFRKLIY